MAPCVASPLASTTTSSAIITLDWVKHLYEGVMHHEWYASHSAALEAVQGARSDRARELLGL